MIPLSQIFEWAVSERPSVRGPIRGAKKRSRRGFAAKRKKKNRKAARRIRLRSGSYVAPPSSSQPKFRREISAKGVLALLGIFLLLAVGTLNQRHELPPSADDAYTPETPNQLLRPQLSPNIGLKVDPDEPAENYDEEVSPDAVKPWVKLSDLAAEEPLPEQEAALEAQHHDNEFASNTPETQSELDHRLSVSENFGLRGLPKIGFPTRQSLITYEESIERVSLGPAASSPPPTPNSGLRWKRLALIQTGSLGLTVAGFRKFDQYFGGSQRPFRVGNDWSKDRTLHFDELIHFQGGYRIAQGLIGLYRWSGMNATWSECLGAGTAATVMTLLEYVDGRRPKPKQGASYSDFTANLLGVGFALAKMHVNALEDVDLRLNYTSFGDVLHKRTLLKYDRMTHWLTYSMERQFYVPLNIGVGYGVQNAFKRNVHSEVYIGLGFTPADILARYAPSAAKPLSWLGIYHVGWQVQVK